MGYIYKITNIITGGIYVGQTRTSLHKRFKTHKTEISKIGNKKFRIYPLYYDMKKYGVENFLIEPLEYVEDNKKLNELEIYYIKKLDSFRKHNRNNYNLTKGGFYVPPTKFRIYGLKYNLIKINKNNGEIEKIYTNRDDLLKDYKRKQLDTIHKVIAGQSKSAYGFYWKTLDREEKDYDFIKYTKGKKIYYKDKKILKIETTT